MSKKWETLEHNGVYFPDPYQPHNKKLMYDGKKIDLSPEAEEVATFYAAVLNTPNAENDTFNNNFFNDFKEILKEYDRDNYKIIKKFDKLDFSRIRKYLDDKKLKDKSLSKEDKKELKLKKEKSVEKYTYAKIDGKTEKVGNFRVEPPGLFRGRGSHPKTGKIKRRVEPEDIIINIGEKAKVPKPPKGHDWKKVVHDNNATWLANWKENINNQIKYIWLGTGSTFKNDSDASKFNKARELSLIINDIRTRYTEDLESKISLIKQRATALYLIDKLALRAGNEKGADTADTVGCTTLKVKHIELESPSTIIFDFLGKDSIRYYNKVEVEKQVYKNIKEFKKGKNQDEMLFDKLTSSLLNKYLNSLMDGLTAKVFRTFNASYTFQKELKQTNLDFTLKEKLEFYNRANKEVAVLCNHQKAIPKTFDDQITKMKDRIKEFKKQITEESSESKKEKLQTKIDDLKSKMKLKEENKCVALGTSKINYIDPRISVSWSKKYDVPINKLFPKTLLDKFEWAMTVSEKWKFKSKKDDLDNQLPPNTIKIKKAKFKSKSPIKRNSKKTVKSKSPKKKSKSPIKRKSKKTVKSKSPKQLPKTIKVVNYSEKFFAIIGKTKEYKDILKENGGKYNPNLTFDGIKIPGWIFSLKSHSKNNIKKALSNRF